MNVYLSLGLVLFLFSLLNKNREKSAEHSFLFCFIAIIVFAAIRYEYGPDYFSYRDMFDQIQAKGLDHQLYDNDHTEELFLRFLSLFNSYFVFIIVQSIFFLSVLYLLFKKYVSFNFYYIIILLMFLNQNFILVHLVAIRSSIATCFFFIGLMCFLSGLNDYPIIDEATVPKAKIIRKLFLYLLMVFLGSLFHTSILIFIIIPLFANDKVLGAKNSSAIMTLTIFLAVIMVPFQSRITMIISLSLMDLFPESFGKYDDYFYHIADTGGGLGVLLFNSMKVAIALPIIHTLTKERDYRFLRIRQFAIVFILLLLIINENILGRYTMCFYPVILIALLRSYMYANNTQKVVSMISLLLLSAYSFYISYNMSSFETFMEYHTIFSAPSWQ